MRDDPRRAPEESLTWHEWAALPPSIQALVEERQRVLVVQRTGWGKSLVYFIATRLLREQGAGMTLLISPLLSLMRNQLDMAQRIGLRAHTIHRANQKEWDDAESAIERDECDLLLGPPERLHNQRFTQTVLPGMTRRIGLFVVDEAHCISPGSARTSSTSPSCATAGS